MREPTFFTSVRPLTLAEIAVLTGGELLVGSGECLIRTVAPLDAAKDGDLTFLDNPRYRDHFRTTQAAACLIRSEHRAFAPPALALIAVPDPYRAMALVMQALYPDAVHLKGPLRTPGIASSAFLDVRARLEEGVTIEPGAAVGADAEIGRDTVIAANAVIGENVRIGRNCYIGPGASITHTLIGDRVIIHAGARLGQDGFGFALGGKQHLKIPQIGRVVIQDDVEIGANTTIDRGSNRDTIIGEGTKIDNGVQIAHNVVVGRHCIIVAQAGIAGSAILEDFVAVGGQAGIAGHVRIGAGAQIAGSASVKDDVPQGARVVGSPAKPVKNWMREQRALNKIAVLKGGEDQS